MGRQSATPYRRRILIACILAATWVAVALGWQYVSEIFHDLEVRDTFTLSDLGTNGCPCEIDASGNWVQDCVGNINVSSSKITSLGTPSAGTDATTKTYVDNLVSAAASVAATLIAYGTGTGITGDPDHTWDAALNAETIGGTSATASKSIFSTASGSDSTFAEFQEAGAIEGVAKWVAGLNSVVVYSKAPVDQVAFAVSSGYSSSCDPAPCLDRQCSSTDGDGLAVDNQTVSFLVTPTGIVTSGLEVCGTFAAGGGAFLGTVTGRDLTFPTSDLYDIGSESMVADEMWSSTLWGGNNTDADATLLGNNRAASNATAIGWDESDAAYTLPLDWRMGTDTNKLNVSVNGNGYTTFDSVGASGAQGFNFDCNTSSNNPGWVVDCDTPAVLFSGMPFAILYSGGPQLVFGEIAGTLGNVWCTGGVCTLDSDTSSPWAVGQGTSAASAGIGGAAAFSTTQVGNAVLSESDLWSYSVPASTLGTNGDTLEMWAGGTFGATVSIDKRVRVKFGATTIFDSGALTGAQSQEWRVECDIARTGAATQKSICSFSTSGVPTGVNYVDFTSPAETLSGAVTLKVTGAGTNANDVVFELGKVFWQPPS